MEKLHCKSLRPVARHGMRKLWLVSITKPWKVTGSWVSGARVSNPPGWKKGSDMIVWDLRVKFLTYMTARDRDRRGRERCREQLSTWRARSGADDVRKVMHLAPLKLYAAWLRGGHRASALNANGTSDTKAKGLREPFVPSKSADSLLLDDGYPCPGRVLNLEEDK